MRPIIIDAATIFDPARLIAVLASVDIRYSEVWVSQRYDHFKEKDFITGFGTESKFALLSDENGRFKAEPLNVPLDDACLDPNSYITGPQILRWALKRGMAVPKDLYKYENLAREMERENNIASLSEAIMLGAPAEYDLRAGKQITEDHLKKTGQTSLGPNYAWRLEPYGIGSGLGIILAASQEEDAEPFISHPNFRDNISTHNYTYYKRESAIALATRSQERKPDFSLGETLSQAKNLLSSPEPVNISQVAFYLDQSERIDHLTGIINASHELENRNKDIGIITSKAVGTYAFDTLAFGGLPVTTGLVSLFDIGTRFFRSKR